jgi:hypothetical protein
VIIITLAPLPLLLALLLPLLLLHCYTVLLPYC